MLLCPHNKDRPLLLLWLLLLLLLPAIKTWMMMAPGPDRENRRLDNKCVCVVKRADGFGGFAVLLVALWRGVSK